MRITRKVLSSQKNDLLLAFFFVKLKLQNDATVKNDLPKFQNYFEIAFLTSYLFVFSEHKYFFGVLAFLYKCVIKNLIKGLVKTIAIIKKHIR